MKPYTLMFVKSDSSEHKLFYSNLNKEKRIKLKDELQNNNGHLYCNCNYPDSKLELQITVDDKIAPKAHHYIHADSCPKSELSKKFIPYNSAFYRIDGDENNIFAHVSLDFSPKTKEHNSNQEYHTYKEPVINAKMTVSALVKKINMVTFQDMAFSKNAVNYLSIEDFCRWVKWKTKYIYIAKEKNLQSLSLDKDHKKFFYGIYNCSKPTSKVYMQIVLTEFYSKKDTDTGNFINASCKLNLSYKKEYFDFALKEFEKTYNGMTVDSAIESEYSIVCSGFYTKSTSGFFTCLDIHFILVNKNGLFSESKYEADMYDNICQYLNYNNLKSKYAFYKPWEFCSTIYNNDYLEDGIFYNKHTDEEYYLEVFGMKTPNYLATKARKESIAKDRLISWNAAINDPMPNLSKYIN